MTIAHWHGGNIVSALWIYLIIKRVVYGELVLLVHLRNHGKKVAIEEDLIKGNDLNSSLLCAYVSDDVFQLSYINTSKWKLYIVANWGYQSLLCGLLQSLLAIVWGCYIIRCDNGKSNDW